MREELKEGLGTQSQKVMVIVDGTGNKGMGLLLKVVMMTNRGTKKNLMNIGREEVNELNVH